jgi:hypothetical protein
VDLPLVIEGNLCFERLHPASAVAASFVGVNLPEFSYAEALRNIKIINI